MTRPHQQWTLARMIEQPDGRPAGEQALLCGSWAMVPPNALFARLGSFTLQAMIWPTLPGRGRQAIMGTWSETLGTGFGLALDEAGALEVRVGSARVTGEVL